MDNQTAPATERRKLIASPGARAAAVKAGLVIAPNDDPLKVIEHSATAPSSREARIDAMRQELQQRFPQVFARPDIPLAVGMRDQLIAVIPHSRKILCSLLHRWTRTPAYMAAIAAGEMRRNLDGSPAGQPTASDRASAAERLRAQGTS